MIRMRTRQGIGLCHCDVNEPEIQHRTESIWPAFEKEILWPGSRRTSVVIIQSLSSQANAAEDISQPCHKYARIDLHLERPTG